MTEQPKYQPDPSMMGVYALNNDMFWPIIKSASAHGVGTDTLILCMLDLASEIFRHTYPTIPHEYRASILSDYVEFCSAEQERANPQAQPDMTNIAVHPLWRDLYQEQKP